MNYSFIHLCTYSAYKCPSMHLLYRLLDMSHLCIYLLYGI